MTEQELTTLQKITSVPGRSNKHGFTDRTRLFAIRSLLKGTPYHAIHEGKNSTIYARKKDLPKDLIVISGHADVVQGIHADAMHSACNDRTDVLKGNYDNAGCNAAMVELMKRDLVPFENVVFAFTADEETGRCNGAKEVMDVLSKHDLTAVALDVTYENHDGCMYSVENPMHPELKRIAREMQKFDEPLLLPAGRYVRLNGRTDLSFVTSSRVSNSTSWLDEGQIYGKKIPSLSFCLPLLGGDMHSDEGVQMYGNAYLGYIASLAGLTYVLNKEKIPEALNGLRIPLSEKLKEQSEIRIPAYTPCDGEQMTFASYFENDGLFSFLLEQAQYYDEDGYDDFWEDLFSFLPEEFYPEDEEAALQMDEEVELAWQMSHPPEELKAQLEQELGKE